MPCLNIPVRKISISLSPKLLERVDQAADRDYATRSDIIRQALVQYLEDIEKGTEYTDSHRPETIAVNDDFTDVWARYPYVQPNDVELLQFLRDQDQAGAV